MPLPYFHSYIYAILMVTMIPVVCTHVSYNWDLKGELPLTEIYSPNQWKWTLFFMVWTLVCDAITIIFVDSGYLNPILLVFLAYGAWAPFSFLSSAKMQYRLFHKSPESTIPTFV